jgi:hypothetical protein
MDIHAMGAALIHVDRQVEMMKLTGAFCNCWNTPNKLSYKNISASFFCTLSKITANR